MLHYLTAYFDLFLVAKGKVLPDLTFELFEHDSHGTVVSKVYKGPLIIVDNGYLRWSTTVPPFKLTMNVAECRWSHWCESLQKDVECTFGILNGRWRILKMGIRLQGIETCNNIWLTCCALHNWLLEVNGLDGEWEGAIGQLEARDVIQHVPFAMQHLALGYDPREYDESGLGPGEDRDEHEVVMPTVNDEQPVTDTESDSESAPDENRNNDNENGVRLVRHLS